MPRDSSPRPRMNGLFPTLLRCLPSPHNWLLEAFEEQKEFVAEVGRQHEFSLDAAQPQDFIDAVLMLM